MKIIFRGIYAREKVTSRHPIHQPWYIFYLRNGDVSQNTGITLVCFLEHVNNHFINRYLTAKKIIPPCGWLLTHLSRLPYCFVRNPLLGNEISFSRAEKAARRQDTMHYSGMERTAHVQPSIAYDSRKDYVLPFDARRAKLSHFYSESTRKKDIAVSLSRSLLSEKMSCI